MENFNYKQEELILDSERMYSITSRNNAPISNFGGGFRCKKKLKKKLRKNGNFYAKPVFDQIDFLYGCNSKTNHCNCLKFSPNVYVIQIFTKSVENAKICMIKNTTLIA
ncbi:hypothetical protein FWK35_00009709 [Aphis craccivora]|uniref:Uncharacterized protein n=1 Tax=Aphis craccivora TaxID=307492 RepID=A0A6G0ZAB3_APHCR|nr:hypothetical protein FWK35_00009709 [Aphis craccivora]